MKITSLLPGLAASALLVFSWWGQNTKAGEVAWPGLNQMVPYFAGVAGVVLFFVALILFIIHKLRTQDRQQPK